MPVLPATGRPIVFAFVPVPDLVTCCSAYDASAATSSLIAWVVFSEWLYCDSPSAVLTDSTT